MTSNDKDFSVECYKLFQMFRDRGYPEEFIYNIWEQVKEGRKDRFRPILGLGPSVNVPNRLNNQLDYKKAFITEFSANSGLIRDIICKEWDIFKDITDLENIHGKDIRTVFRKGKNVKNILETRFSQCHISHRRNGTYRCGSCAQCSYIVHNEEIHLSVKNKTIKGEGLENFWKVLVEGKNCTVEIPSERFNTKLWYHQDDKMPGKICTSRAALIDGFNGFDHTLFGISKEEADRMDPQQKLLLECTYRALEDAGTPLENISGTRTGVFIGLMNRDFEVIVNDVASNINHYSVSGAASSIAANRISYCFNLTGPSLTIDTACSSSLVALHYACQAIKQGDCEMALCGGVSCIIEPRIYVALSKAKMISADGVCKPFSNRADGYGRGEGCGVLLLKPLKMAIKDCNKVWGIIVSSVVNQDGKSVRPITKPSQSQQEALLRMIYTGHLDPSCVQYVEAHGTGTPAGDITEATSIANILGKPRDPGVPPLRMGSVKGNIGHTESAAGVASIIKVLLMMEHETIVPSLYYTDDSDGICAGELNIKIPTTVEKWDDFNGTGRIAALNSFGFGGTNAHVVVKHYRQASLPSSRQRPWEILVMSATSQKMLKQNLMEMIAHISKDSSVTLQNMAYTSACRRSHESYRYRKSFISRSLSDLQQQFKLAVGEDIDPKTQDTQLIFVFSGSGAAYNGMCKELLKAEPVFKGKINEIEDIIQKYTPLKLSHLIENDFADLTKPNIVQPLLFAIQVALAALLEDWGIKPDVVVGHSAGEVAAAYCSGLICLSDAVHIVYHKSELQAKVVGGKMLVVSNIPVTEVSKILDSYQGELSIAAFNSPVSCTVAGDTHALETLYVMLSTSYDKTDIFLHMLDCPVAYHSPMMDSIMRPVEDSIGKLQPQKLKAELISTVTGTVAGDGDFTTGRYWSRNIREPVMFENSIKSAIKGKPKCVFIEIGPRSVLKRNLTEILGNAITVIPAAQPGKDYETLLTLIARLFELGYNLQWQHIFVGYEGLPAPFPKYHFDHFQTYMNYEVIKHAMSTSVASRHPLIFSTSSDQRYVSCMILPSSTPYVYEHKNNGIVIIPGSVYVELGIASVLSGLKPELCLRSCQLSVTFFSPCIITENPTILNIKIEPQGTATKFSVMSLSTTYAAGQLQQQNSFVLEEIHISLEHIFLRCKTHIKGEELYEKLSKIGFQYGPVFRQLSSVFYNEDLKEAITVIRVPEQIVTELNKYFIHPVVLDYFLQMSIVVAQSNFKSKAVFPSFVNCLAAPHSFQPEMIIYLKISEVTPHYMDVCGCFADINGFVLVELKHVRIAFLTPESSVLDHCFFHNEWKLMPVSTVNSDCSPTVLFFLEKSELAQSVVRLLPYDVTYVTYSNVEITSMADISKLCVSRGIRTDFSEYDEVWFMVGNEDLSNHQPSKLLECLLNICDIYRQVVLKVRERKNKCSVRTITYRATEQTVAHVNAGFVICGMTRACAAEIPALTFQLIDLGSHSMMNIQALADMLTKYKASDFPEVVINHGNIYTSEIAHTVHKQANSNLHAVSLDSIENYAVSSSHPYETADVVSQPEHKRVTELSNHAVEIEINNVCIHSSDYFPVTESFLQHGNTLYWSRHVREKHALVALDFNGTVTATGQDVKGLKVGDHIISSYPVKLFPKIAIPETVCYKSQKLHFLKYAPCLSYFILAWEIFQQTLPRASRNSSLVIVSITPEAVLYRVLLCMANECGWQVSTETKSTALPNMVKCDALIFLPPFGKVLSENIYDSSLVKHIVIVGNGPMQSTLLNSVIKGRNEDTQVHSLCPKNIFQKPYLKKIKPLVYRWILSSNISKSLAIPYSVFQAKKDSTEVLHSTNPQTYFICTAISVIVLKPIISNNVSSIMPVNDAEKQLFRHDSSYIVTGGLSGLGFETVKFIAKHGGGSILILSRKAPTTERQAEIDNLQTEYKGTKIISLPCDVGVWLDVQKMMTLIGKLFPSAPVKGVFHSAVVLNDGLLPELHRSLFEKVFVPKVGGAINLHNATKALQLDYFVCYSSMTSFIGNIAQSNYAAANSFIDAFCHYRRNCGLPAQSINWGPMSIGLLLNKKPAQNFLESKGLLTLNISEIHVCLEKCLTQNYPQQAIGKFDFRKLMCHALSENLALRKRFNSLMSEEIYRMNTEYESERVAKPALIKPSDYIRSFLSEISHSLPHEISSNTLLSVFGLDSMSGITFQNQIFQETGIYIPLVKILDPNTTISVLESYMKENCLLSP
ncbi:probable polyketide synthase 1 [Protopterus annectens]|uniref:probable polyketide synthase 1 n=1 Tax=Protopterus annectens TaxID=7888 RepID=UPI001CFB1C1E|nr:probable polyketide synthase 1 [Protopterus annectens]